MRVKQMMYLSTIIGIIYLSGECFSNLISQESLNSTLQRNDQINNTSDISIKSMKTMNISKKYCKNETFNDSSLSFVVNNKSEILKSTNFDLNNNDDCENKTIPIFDTFADENETIKSENLSLQQFNYDNLNLKETAGFAAIGFLAFSVIGYTGFVLWRRYLQNKYGNGQVLITEDVYDISDLRNYEI